MRTRPLPNTFIVGAPKCGTTYLAAWLGLSPDVFTPPVKEPGFFCELRQYDKGLDHYYSAYYRGAGEEKVVLDATPWYLYPSSVPGRIADSLGTDVRILVLVREPVARSVSMYYDQVSRMREPRPLDQAVEDDLAVADPVAAVAQEAGPEVVHHYVLCSRYAESVERYLERFGPQAVKVMAAEDLWGRPEEIRDQLEKFLGVPISAAPDRAANPASRPRLAPVEHALSRMEGSRSAIRSAVGRVPLAAGTLRRVMDAAARWNQVPTRYPAVDPDMRSRLYDWFEPHSRRLEQLTGQTFEQWR